MSTFIDAKEDVRTAGSGIVTDAEGRALSLERPCALVARNAVARPL